MCETDTDKSVDFGEYGFIRVAAGSPSIRVADPLFNAKQALALIERASNEGVSLLCLPELCLTGATCQDLFFQDALIDGALEALKALATKSVEHNVISVVGLPLLAFGSLYNVAAVIYAGRVLGFIPKFSLETLSPMSSPTVLSRFSRPPLGIASVPLWEGISAPMGRLVFSIRRDTPFSSAYSANNGALLTFTAAVGNDYINARAGSAAIIANLRADREIAGESRLKRTAAISRTGGASGSIAYISAGAGSGESTQSAVYGGYCLVCENGKLLSESRPFGAGWAVADIDSVSVGRGRGRGRATAGAQSGFFAAADRADTPPCVGASIGTTPREAAGAVAPIIEIPFRRPAAPGLLRRADPLPFIPEEPDELAELCEEILAIQSRGLSERIKRAGCERAVVGVSGGLDSALALLVAIRAHAELGISPGEVVAATMPCFGTTKTTYDNAVALCKALGTPCLKIDITDTVRSALRDVGADENARDVVYENTQARVRTVTLLGLANARNGVMVGPGDLSELALGFMTYGGDQVSMYGVNSGVPKTLIRRVIRHVAKSCDNPSLCAALERVLEVPISPELLPPQGDGSDAQIAQITENLIGPYELHDFFLYHTALTGRDPKSVLALAQEAFKRPDARGSAVYDSVEVEKWYRVFIKRFFANQFKRDSMPNAPATTVVSLSAREGGWNAPSDAAASLWNI